MARMLTFLAFVILLLNSLSFNVASRRIVDAERLRYISVANRESFGEMKSSGPSTGGKGHGFPTITSLGNIKNSGPSSGGKGHESRNGESLGDMKNPGPSAGGKGHGFRTNEMVHEIHNSGPSPGGEGH
ncbi:hypothetical protein L1987_51545 [Smallanthus sonchifolius]|uniref:Uncharacterized protein n=1 Tax=Smallanthus sonchifolius TaxID=185202 RepID=A0ACB9EQK3_9ASTR|nr:hypothetical protein L1987_51545 [Smallanthus sonchifolius]